jgi:hypothetical protein
MQPRPKPLGHNVVATFDGMDAARRAMSQLERRGIDAVHISLIGETATEARSASETADTLNTHDTKIAGFLARRTFGLSFASAVALGTIGFIFGAFAHRPMSARYEFGAAAVGALIGALCGFLFGGVLSLPVSRDWELTFESTTEGRVMVAVHADERSVAVVAVEVLGGQNPRALERYDRRGRKLVA